MYNCVTENDSIIRTFIKGNGPIIEPPMSGMITKEAYTFMEKMLEHPTTKDALSGAPYYQSLVDKCQVHRGAINGHNCTLGV